MDRARSIVREAVVHHPLSRLDVDVTGVVLFALTRAATTAAEVARKGGRYRRTYVGLLPEPPSPASGEWTWTIATDARDPTRRTTGPGIEPQAAVTRYETLAVASGLAVVAFRPVTGRTHQIRVHAAAAGVPIVGDQTYGGARRCVLADGSVVSGARVLLHAWAVEVPDGEWVVSDPPLDLTEPWEAAGGDPSVWALDPARISGMTLAPSVGL